MATRTRRSLLLGGTAITAAAGSTALGVGAGPAHAQSFVVTDLTDSLVATPGSLRYAIEQANATAGPDTIGFASGLTGTINLTKRLEITDSVTIDGPGDGVQSPITIDGQNLFQGFYINSPASQIDVTIDGLTVTHGIAQLGGGIHDRAENLTLDQMRIIDNTGSNNDGSGWGGGVWAGSDANFTLTITRSTISGNDAETFGGGVYVRQNVAIVPVAEGDSPRESLVVTGPNDVRIADTTIDGNTAQLGGGVYAGDLDGHVLAFDHSTISNNVAANSGGGIWAFAFDGTFRMSESTVSGNESSSTLIGSGGAGIFGNGGISAALIDHSTIVRNVSDAEGGGILADDGALNLDHVILADNTAATTGPDISGPGADVAANYSLIEQLGAVVPAGGNNIIGQDPALGPLADNHGPTLTHLPLAGSPAIDHGDPAFTEPVDGDQRHSTRVVNVVDIGAVETMPPPVDDAYSTPEDIPLVIAAGIGVLANDPSPANSTVTVVTPPAHGTLVLQADGSFTYVPNLNYNGPDQFTYTQSHAVLGATGTAVARITVTPVNDPPNAVDDATSLPYGAGPTPVAVLGNDTDPDGDALSVVAVTQGSKGSVTFTATGVTYTPAAGATGVDTFTYTISDGGLTDTATVTITIAAPPPPVVLPATGGGARESAPLALAFLGAGAALTAASKRRSRRPRAHP